MSQIVRGILGAIAITGTLGAAQLAVGEDLGRTTLVQQASAVSPSGQDVNRSGKGDRATTAGDLQAGQTFSVTLIGQSVLVRVSRDQAEGAAIRTPADRKSVV